MPKTKATGPTNMEGLFSMTAYEKRKKYVTKQFQAYGLQLAEELDDWANRTLYIKLAKTTDPKLLEQARLFVRDQLPRTIRSKARLFMWKLKQLKKTV